ncbi:MAG TPA: hypothetical protein VM223_28510 [Planctomycetota bacterium]|nr:hypothetical protein [Planctomycetota bacterium]
MGTSYLGGELHDEYLGEESLQTEMDAAFKDAEWAESEAGDMLLAANEPMDMRSRSDSSFSMDWQMPQNTPRRKSAISMGGSGAYGSRGGGGGSYPRQGRRSTVLYPAAEARRQTAGQQPPQPAIDADVRAVVETFAKGPTDFRFRSVTTNYAKNGKVESRSESLRAAVGKRFVREYSSEGEVTSRTLCDGDLVYICHEHTQYAAARKATDDDFRSRDLPGNSDSTPEQIVGQGTARIESRDGDVAVVCVDSVNNRARYFVDLAKKALVKMEHYRQQRSSGPRSVQQAAAVNGPADGDFRLTGRTECDEHKLFGERMLPLRQRYFNADGNLGYEIRYDEMEVGRVDAKVEFAPPTDWLVAVYPLPNAAEAKRRVDEVERRLGEITGREHFVLALVLEQAGRFAEAAKAVQRAMETRKDDPYLVLYHGLLRAQGGDKQALIEAAAKAEQMADGQQKYRVIRAIYDLLGQAGMESERQPYVQMLFDLAPRTSSDPVNWCGQLARFHKDAGDLAKARELWQKLLAEMPENGYAWSQAAQFYGGYPETADEAEAAYLKARELGYNISSSLASFYRNRGEYDKAIVEFRQSIDRDYVDSWRVRELLTMIDETAGGEAALKEAESLLAAQKDSQKRKQIALGCLYYVRDNDRGAVGAPEFIKRLSDAFLDETDVLRELLQMRQYSGVVLFDPMPEIEKRFAGRPADYGQALWRVQAIGAMANGDYRDAALRLLAALPEPEFEMTEQQRSDYAYQLATAKLRVQSDDAMAACERVIGMDFPEGDNRPRDIRRQLIDALIEKNEPDKAIAVLVEAVKNDRNDANLTYTMQRVIRRLQESKRTDLLLALYSAMRETMPEQDWYCRIQIALLKLEQKKTQEAYDELWSVLLDTDAALAAQEDGEDEQPADAAYYFYHAGRALLKVSARDDELKAKLDAAVAGRAGTEKPDGDARWNALQVDLLRARGRFQELVALLQKLSGREADGDAWSRRLASVYAGTRRYQDAADIYQKLVEKDPGDFAALMELCKLAAAQRQTRQEQEYWQAFLKALPEDDNYLSQLARQLSQSGQTARAIDVYEKLLSIASYRANNLAEEYQKLGRKLDAAMAYVRATRPGNRNRSTSYGSFGQIWPLIREEGTFDKFAAAVEQEIAATDDARHRARLMGLLADIYAKRDDKQQAASWARKALADPAGIGQEAFDAALPVYRTAAPDRNLVPVLQKAVDELTAAGQPVPDWLRVRLARELFHAGNSEEGEKILRAIIEQARPRDSAATLVELADLLGKTEPARAVAIYDEAAASADVKTARTALLRRAELLASVKDTPADDVLAAYRAAANLGNADSRREAIDAMAKFATDRKLHDGVIEAQQLACRYARWDAGSRIRHLAEYLRSQKLDDRVEPAVRGCIREMANAQGVQDVWRQFGQIFADAGDPAKAIAIWAEGLRQPSGLDSWSKRSELIDAICYTARDRRNSDKIDRAAIAKLIEDEMDRFVKDVGWANSDWSVSYWRMARELELADRLLAKLKESPAGQKAMGNAYHRLGDSYRDEGKEQHDTALHYYKMALDAGGLRNRDSLLFSMISIYKDRQDWQGGLDCAELLEGQRDYQRQMHRGFFLAKLGRMDETAAAYEDASKMLGGQRRDYGNRRQLGASAREAGLFDFAIKALNLAIWEHDLQQRGNTWRDENHLQECYRELARCYHGKGETEKAIDQLLLAQTRVAAGRRSDIHRDLLAMFKDDAALNDYIAKYEREAAETKLEKPGLRALFGDVFREKQQWDEALRHYQAALDTAPNRGDIRERAVEILRRQNRRDELIRQYREWATYDPKNIQNYRQLGQLLKDAGRETDAMRAYSTMLEAMPTEAESHREMAGIYSRERRFPEAIAMWKKVVQYRPEEPQSYYGLAQSYAGGGQRNMANGVYEEMLAKKWEDRFGNVATDVRERMRKMMNAE